MIFFTDESKTDLSSFGLYVEKEASIRFNDTTTVSKAEALAINYCAKEKNIEKITI